MGISILERLIFESYLDFQPNVQEELINKYVDLVKYLHEKSYKEINSMEYFTRIMDQALDTHYIILLKKLLEIFPEDKSDYKYNSYNHKKTTFDIVKHLVEEF